MADKMSPQGYVYDIFPTADSPFWNDSESKTEVNITATASVDDTTGAPAVTVTKSGEATTPVFSFAFTGLKGETGATGPQGETGAKGETGPQGPAGTDAVLDKSAYVASVSITNTNGVYDIKTTNGAGTEADAGSIEVPNTDSLIAEITDSVVENTTNDYDFHTIKETENNGAQNDVGKFYIARNQISNISYENDELTIKFVNQNGEESSKSYTISSGSGESSAIFSGFVPYSESLAKGMKLYTASFSDDNDLDSGFTPASSAAISMAGSGESYGMRARTFTLTESGITETSLINLGSLSTLTFQLTITNINITPILVSHSSSGTELSRVTISGSGIMNIYDTSASRTGGNTLFKFSLSGYKVAYSGNTPTITSGGTHGYDDYFTGQAGPYTVYSNLAKEQIYTDIAKAAKSIIKISNQENLRYPGISIFAV